MSELVLIDTSVWIAALRVGGPVVVRHEVEQLLAASRAATTPIVMLELLSGTRSSREFRELKEDLEALGQLELTPAVWERAYRLGCELRRAGLTVPIVDILIATLALEHGCMLLHADRHFEQIARHSPLRTRSLL
ncbi:PIN domain nuclease [Candidatus Acetothermia bacterium]|jgi:predicted nucleic acid-binding protein|nr:PIN domain nuclease [Candidatus Acetothermia bacterium]MCI2432159.1 PIN domain nuclease [Candidatus Acetothermia bacterium]MCI2436148.1 PIN domain nuclease [Candidatus Acetothermia bacterium]